MSVARFAYYKNLSAKDRRTYRASDAVTELAVPDVTALRPLVAALEEVLSTGSRVKVARAANAFAAGLFDQLQVPRVRVQVRGVRRVTGDAELHGLYTFATEEAPATIEVWMRTAAHKNVVRFRTFMRTLLHEIVHHVDLTKLGFSETFHTHGFFKRESSLQRQLVPALVRRERSAPAPEPPPAQLDLFGSRG